MFDIHFLADVQWIPHLVYGYDVDEVPSHFQSKIALLWWVMRPLAHKCLIGCSEELKPCTLWALHDILPSTAFPFATLFHQAKPFHSLQANDSTNDMLFMKFDATGFIDSVEIKCESGLHFAKKF